MSVAPGRTVLVLGGAGSGHTDHAERLLADTPAPLRLVTDRPAPQELCRALEQAADDRPVLVPDLAAWLGDAPGDDAAAERLAAALRRCPAPRVVVVGTEVGWAPVADPAARARVDWHARVHRALSQVADRVVLVVAGRAVTLPPTGVEAVAAPSTPAAAVATPPDGTADETPVGPGDEELALMPEPDEAAREAVAARLAGAGLGTLTTAVAAAACGVSDWSRVRVLLLHGGYAGDAAAGEPAAGPDAAAALHHFADAAGVTPVTVPTPSAAPLEAGPVLPDEEAERALAGGWRLGHRAADEGMDAVVIAATGPGADTAAAAVVAALRPDSDLPALLARVRAADGTYDDAAWVRRCVAARDAVARVRRLGRTSPREVLAELGGGPVATAAGVVLAAASRRTPVLVDGPVGAAGALVAATMTARARRWCLLTDHGGRPVVQRVATLLGLTPASPVGLDLGEGAASLAVLPLLRAATRLAGGPATGSGAARTAA